MGTFRDIRPVGERQAGRITRAQMHLCGITDSMIRRWVQNGWLIWRLPKVYALGNASQSQEARLWEAVLYAGPGAMLSHLTAAQWHGYLKYAPQAVHVSTPRKIASVPGIVVHARRQLRRAVHAGMPVTGTAQTMLDLAIARPDLLPRALGQVEFLEDPGLEILRETTRSQSPGSVALRDAVDRYDPNFHDLNDEFEINFYEFCQAWAIDPLRLPNVEVVPGVTIDGLWPDHHLGVELDGSGNHHTRAQLLRDAERDLTCRQAGLTVIRYRKAQLVQSPGRVRADLEQQLALRTPRIPPV